MSFIILKHIISLETTLKELSDFSLGVLILCLSAWRSKTVRVVIVASSSNFFCSCKLSFNHFSSSIYVFSCKHLYFSYYFIGNLIICSSYYSLVVSSLIWTDQFLCSVSWVSSFFLDLFLFFVACDLTSSWTRLFNHQ